ncbi:MAG: tetratricopeptide repeat protein [Bacteroidota bacterium]
MPEKDYDQLIESGLEAVHDEKYELAEALFQEAIQDQPALHEGYMNLGSLYQMLTRHEEAMEAYEKVLSIDPNIHDARFCLGISEAALGHHQKAIDTFDSLLNLEPDYTRALYLRGLSYKALGSWEEAEEDLEAARIAFEQEGDRGLAIEAQEHIEALEARAAVKELAFQELLYHFGRAKSGNQFALAYIWLRELRDRRPEETQWVEQEIDLLTQMGEHERIQEALSRAKVQFADSVWPFVSAARYHRAQGQDTRAHQAAEQALQVDPDDEDALYERAFYLENEEEKYQMLSKVIEGGSSATPALFERGKLLLAQGKWEEALDDLVRFIRGRHAHVEAQLAISQIIDHYDEAVAAAPEDPAIRQLRARALQHIGRYEESGLDWAYAIKLSPSDPKLYQSRAATFSAAYDHNKALTNLNKAIHIDSSDSELFADRAAALLHLQNTSEAKSDILEAIKLNPDEVTYYLLLGKAERLLENEQGSHAAFEQAAQAGLAHPELERELAMIALEREDLGAATRHFEEALSFGPNYRIMIDLAMTLQARGEYEEAKKYLDEAVYQFPGRPEAMKELGLLFLSTEEETREAVFLLRTAYEANPQDIEALFGYVVALYRMEQWQLAWENAARYLVADPEDISMRKIRGIAAFHIEDFETARRDLAYVREGNETSDREVELIWGKLPVEELPTKKKSWWSRKKK